MFSTEFVTFNELLRPPGQLALGSKVQPDPKNPDAVLIVPAIKKEWICSYAGRMRVFYIFTAYRSHYYPELGQLFLRMLRSLPL